MFRPALERLEDRWVPSALAIKIQSGAISFIVNDGDPGDLDVLPNQVRVQSGIGGTPAIPGFNIVTSSALTNSPGSASGALLQTSYALTALSAGGGTVTVTTSATGFAQPPQFANPLTLVSQLNGNGNGSGSITAQAWADPSNTQFGMGANTPGPQGPFDTGATGGYASQATTTFNRGAGPYALTSQFTATVGAGSNTTGSLQLTVPTPPRVAVGDFVWNDANGDGCQDAGELGIPGVTLTLTGTTSGGVAVTDHQTTDAGGKYLFTEAPGTYTVTVDASNFASGGALFGFIASPTLNPGCGTALDSNPNPSGTTPGSLPTGSSDLTVDFGYYLPVQIGDFVWKDTNGDGCQDAGELGIPGVKLTLTGITGGGVAVTDHATTDANGKYLFTEAPGTYTITVDASNFASGGALFGFIASPTLNPGCGTDHDSNPNPSGTTPGTLPSGGTDLTVDFGYYQPAAIGDYLWLDANRDGQQGSATDEPGIDGVTVKLFDSGDHLIGTTTTGDNPHVAGTQHGYYEFTGLTPGVYYVVFSTGGGYDKFTTPNVGSDVTDSDANTATGKTGTYTLASGEFNTTVDAGLLPIDLELSKSVNNTTPNVGSNVVFTVTVTNNNFPPGVSTATGVTVSDVLPAGLTYVSSGASQGSYSDLTKVWTVGTLAPGASAVLTITATVTTGGIKTNFAQVKTTDQIDTDSTPGNNTDTGTRTPYEDDEAAASLSTPAAPGIQIVKTVNKTAVLPFEPVTYTYSVSNTGGVPLSNVIVVDDNGTPGYTADDFNPAPVLGSNSDLLPSDSTHNIGDANNDSKLDTAEVWVYQATVIPVIEECATVNGGTVDAGMLIIQFGTFVKSGNTVVFTVDPSMSNPADSVKVTYLQNQGVNDNRYGTGANAATGWPGGHSFGNLTGSDEAEFRFTNGSGAVVLDFQVDYISAAASATFPSGTFTYASGFGSLGVGGGDGKMLGTVGGTNVASNVLYATTSLTNNLLIYPATSGSSSYLVNSPAETAPLSSVSTVAPQWDYTDSYTVIVSKAAFGGTVANFGGVAVPQQHNSPSKLGTNLIVPSPCDDVVTNTAKVTAIAPDNSVVTDSDTATVHVSTQLGSIGDFVWDDTNANGKQDAGEPGHANVVVKLLDGLGNPVLDGVGNPVIDLTDGNGNYLFDHLPAGQYQVQFVLPGGFTFTTANAGANDAIDSDADQSTGKTAVITLASGATDLTWDAGLKGPPVPGPQIVKDASVATAAPFQPVTYTYTVTNTGSVPLSNVKVVDDNSTPGFAGDDFQPTFVGGDTHNFGFLDPDEAWTYSATVVPPVFMCATVNGQTVDAGTLVIQTLASGDIKVTYLQNQGVNDNRYGTGANAATGWPGGHSFGNLTGSDEAEFRFTNGAGTVVLDFQVDYISAATQGVFPSGTVAYPSGFGTLGVSGGDGKMISGSSANVLFTSTSLTTNLITYPSGFLTNSPAETAPLSSVSTVAPQWDYTNSYTVIVSKAAFGASGFGGVTVPQQHNSPSKLGTNLIIPVPCPDTVINTATVTASNGTSTLTASDTAAVQIVTGQSGQANVVAGAVTTATNKVTIPLTNNGSTSATIKQITLTWPSANGKLRKITLAGKVINDTDVAWSAGGATLPANKGTTGDRSIGAGKTSNLVFEFEKNVLTGPYSFDIMFTDGSTLHVEKASPLFAGDAGTSVVTSDDMVLGRVDAGVYFVSVDGLQGPTAVAEEARIRDAINNLNVTLGSFAVTLVEVGRDAATANIQIRIGDTSPLGGAAQGVLGATESGGFITLLSGWNWYLGDDPSGIGAEQYDFETIVTHELGHAVGLGLSSDTSSAMYPYLVAGDVRRGLTASDLRIVGSDAAAALSGDPAVLVPMADGGANELPVPTSLGRLLVPQFGPTLDVADLRVAPSVTYRGHFHDDVGPRVWLGLPAEWLLVPTDALQSHDRTARDGETWPSGGQHKLAGIMDDDLGLAWWDDVEAIAVAR